MDIGIISRRYARALLAFASERANETKVYEQTESFLARYIQIEDIRHTVENPMVSRTEKIKLLQNATAGKETCEELTRFFGLLLENKREKFIPFIFQIIKKSCFMLTKVSFRRIWAGTISINKLSIFDTYGNIIFIRASDIRFISILYFSYMANTA